MSNIRILVPRRTRKNPNWLIQFARWIGKTRRLIINYKFYRSLNHAPRDAWNKAVNTI